MTYKTSKIFLFIALFFIISIAKTNIAIMEISGTITKSEAGILTDKALNIFANLGEYKVIERTMMTEILKEQEFQQTGCTSSECAVEVGQILGVENIVFGSVGKIGSIYSISLRLIDVATGEVISTSTYELKGDIEDVLVKGIEGSVEDLIKNRNIKQSNNKQNANSSNESFSRRKKVKKIGTIISGAGALLSGGATAYFLINMNKEEETYNNMTIGNLNTFNSQWERVENNRNYAIISGASSLCFTTTAIIFGTLKIKTPKENTISLGTCKTNPLTSISLNYSF